MRNSFVKPSYSFWELDTYFTNIDLLVVGSGIVGLNAAISYKEKYPRSKVLVLERGVLPSGASTKNAGFACFGSASELLQDLERGREELVWDTVAMRIKGLELLRKRLGDKSLDYKAYGGYELFDQDALFEKCAGQLTYLNRQLKPFFKEKAVFSVQNKKIGHFGLRTVRHLIFNKKEGQIDTGRMMQQLIRLAYQKEIMILNHVAVTTLQDLGHSVRLQSSAGELSCRHLIVATNGFAAELLDIEQVVPARAQVLITRPIAGLKIKGTFHYEEGFYYFRNIGSRLLFGGGRNLDFEKETSSEMVLNPKIQKRLDQLLEKMILPDIRFEVEHRWTGIMGVGNEKKPVIRKYSTNIVCAVRMGGMGIAIGSLVGKLAAGEFE